MNQFNVKPWAFLKFVNQVLSWALAFIEDTE